MSPQKASVAISELRGADFGEDVSDEFVEKLRSAKSLLDQFSRCRAEVMKEEFTKILGSKENLCKILDTDLEKGIQDSESKINARKVILGENVLTRKKPMSYCRILGQYAKDPIIILLLSLSVLVLIMQCVQLGIKPSIVADDWVELAEPILIILVVLSVINITTYSDWKQFQDQDKLQKQISDETGVNVFRGGEIMNINSADVVVGDVVILDYGNILRADGHCISSQGLTIDESALTGESLPLIKSPDEDHILFSLTNVIDGKGKFIVTAVGVKSQNGKISQMLGLLEPGTGDAEFEASPAEIIERHAEGESNQEQAELSKSENKKNKQNQNSDSNASVLQLKQAALSAILTKITIAVALVVLVVRLSIYFTGPEFESGVTPALNVASSVLDSLQLAVTIVVVGVPEGILIATTLTATIAAKRMKKDHCVVQFINACETMGNATVICSDKTGTLTQNRMTVVSLFSDKNLHQVAELSKNQTLSTEYVKLLSDSVSYNTNLTSYIEEHKAVVDEKKKKSKAKSLTDKLVGQFDDGKGENEAQQKYDQIGNKTDCALLGLCRELGKDIQDERASLEKHIVKSFPFNSARKSSASLVRNPKDESMTLYIKGASEVILGKCSVILSSSGETRTFEDNEKEDIVNQIIEPLAKNGLRTISIGYKKLEKDVNVDDETLLFSDEFILIGIVGIEDPVRPEVPFCIGSVQRSGVRVIMVTGDNIQTATSIANQCKIVNDTDGDLLLTSKEFNEIIRDDKGEFVQEKFDEIAGHLCVLARAQPEDKNTLVKGIINSKGTGKQEVVAVTGDGTNDAPALTAADVGFAMGIQGTDMAKQSADIVIDDDNFASIVKAMLWGRNMYDSITKFIQFQLSVNFSVLIIIVSTVHEEHYPFRAIPLLWLNLIMDTFASLSLATDWPHAEQLDRKPNTRDQSLISLRMLRKMVGHVVYQSALILVLFFCFPKPERLNMLLIGGSDIEQFIGPDNEESLARLRNTFIFNTFIMLTIFNEFNSRMVMGERNVFARILLNKKFLIIWTCTFIFNTLIILLIGKYIGLESLAFVLNAADCMWILVLCLLIGATALVWEQILLTIVPNTFLERFENSPNALTQSPDASNAINRPSGVPTVNLIRGGSRLNVHRQMTVSGREMNVSAGRNLNLLRSFSVRESVKP